MRIKVKVQTKSKQESIEALPTGELKVKFNAPRENGAANRKLIKLLAEHFNTPQSAITIVSGHKSTRKLVEII